MHMKEKNPQELIHTYNSKTKHIYSRTQGPRQPPLSTAAAAHPLNIPFRLGLGLRLLRVTGPTPGAAIPAPTLPFWTAAPSRTATLQLRQLDEAEQRARLWVAREHAPGVYEHIRRVQQRRTAWRRSRECRCGGEERIDAANTLSPVAA